MVSVDLYSLTNELSKTLHSSDMTVSDAAAAVQKVLSCVSDLRSNQQWSRIWQRCQCLKLRYRRQPRRLNWHGFRSCDFCNSGSLLPSRLLRTSWRNTQWTQIRLNQEVLNILCDIVQKFRNWLVFCWSYRRHQQAPNERSAVCADGRTICAQPWHNSVLTVCNLLVLHTHQDRTDALDLSVVARVFVAKASDRQMDFGHF